ncbi:FecR family protein [Sandaracinus amylolyticus]|uniref:Iron siderophore sensor protein n=1 Tax=Sandaracinus amylolyticus TaxID=927083 RepID=A0A0F6W676_9BACT|nr:FecR family protein [Sandaracinus amylolyticus]AKF08448.1 Iron siderophore sensor protein [Sandaracinus amylolyticus]
MSDERLRASLRDASDEHRLHHNWGAIEARRSARPARGALVIGAAAASIALVVLAIRGSTPRPGPLQLGDGAELACAPGRDLVLADGSRVDVDANSELDVLENDAHALRWWLRAGRARFDVTPGGSRRWIVETGAVVVEVLGTSFTVAHVDGGVRVDVEHGVVLVRGDDVPGGLARLTAGRSMTIGARQALETLVVAARSETPPEATLETAGPERRPARATTAPSRETAPSEAVAPETAPPETAPAEPAAAERRAGDLRDADLLRSQGRVAEAAALLGDIARAHDEPRADRALAAFTLARLALDRLDRPRDAADAFTLALELGLDTTLVEAARARRVEALVRAGETARATEAAREYVRHHPAGRWRHQVERWVAR